MPSKPTLAIVSTFDELCGIAGYTKALEVQLSSIFDIKIFDLDQYFMKSTYSKLRLVGDAIIADMARELARFDCVSIQLEHGIFGSTRKDIVRRLKLLVQAPKRLAVTFHTVHDGAAIDLKDYFTLLMRREFAEIFDAIRASSSATMHGKVLSLLRRRQRTKPTSVIMHTRRDARAMRHANGFVNVYDHPLVFYASGDLPATNVSHLPASIDAIAGVKTIGVFGFLSEYKGFETAIKALKRLPEDYHLLVFGGIHPNAIAKHQAIDPYLQRLLDEAGTDKTAIDALHVNGSSMTINIDSGGIAGLMTGPHDVSRRLHFMGVLDDAGFAQAMRQIDVAVMPYREVGQSSSGPLSIAVDVGARIVAARNKAFLQFARYNPHRIRFFDIGNHVELADNILSVMRSDFSDYASDYNVETNREVYRQALGAAPN